MIIRCATKNPGKLKEFRLAGEHFAKNLFDVRALDNMTQITAPEETGDTFDANAVEKAAWYSAHTTDWLFADDSGLEVFALGGEPGVRSARYAGEDATDVRNNALLLERLQHVPDRSAQFVCVIALARGGSVVKTFRGAVRGRIIDDARGPNGFGYDPLFYYEPFGCTFGEASEDAKMQVSHRAQALEQMFRYLANGGA
jgi:XTP/dITP diphosphohydrolase